MNICILTILSALGFLSKASLSFFNPFSETQGQIVGARESLNRQKNMARRRKVKNGE